MCVPEYQHIGVYKHTYMDMYVYMYAATPIEAVHILLNI